ncbi:MAG TPA: S1 family peptidase [Polyangiaceae bacterium]|nr:S1 family peptidase [Polyangiaceae bacterium]
MQLLGLARWCGTSLATIVLAGCHLSSVVFAPEPEAASVPAAGEERPNEPPIEMLFPDEPVLRVVTGSVSCTGTLIYDNQVLTAHHCVSARDASGAVIHRDVDPEQVIVELGGDYLPWAEVGVRAVVAPSCGHAAGHGDIAILVLDTKLRAKTATPRLDTPPEVGEQVRPVGFGRCDTNGIRRRQRSGGAIQVVDSDRFKLDAAICPGDSGGPALSVERGDVVGVISASVMHNGEGELRRSEFTRLDQWRPVFAAAKMIAEGAESAEVPPVDCPALQAP